MKVFNSLVIVFILIMAGLILSAGPEERVGASAIDLVVFLPNVGKLVSLPTSTPPPTPTPAAPQIANGGFELGRVSWQEYSTKGYDLIMRSGDGFPTAPHNGQWGAWLGGVIGVEEDDVSELYQAVKIEDGSHILAYWIWIASNDWCGFDAGGVLINNDVVDAYWLCGENTTNGWVLRTIDLSHYIGDWAWLAFVAVNDYTQVSNMLIDDVYFLSHTSSMAPSYIFPGGGPDVIDLEKQISGLDKPEPSEEILVPRKTEENNSE